MNPIMPVLQSSSSLHPVQEYTKDYKAGKHAGHTVPHGHHDGVPEDVVPEVVVAGQSDHPSPGHSQREEDLDAGIGPDLGES